MILSSLASAAEPRSHSSTKIYFDADSRVCDPLAELFVDIHKRYPGASYLGEVRSKLFDTTSVLSPPWIDTKSPETDAFYRDVEHSSAAAAVQPFRLEGPGDWSGGALLPAGSDPSGQPRLILVRQDNIGDHGDYQTTVSLLKPNVQLSRISQIMSHAEGRNVADSMIDFVPNSFFQSPSFEAGSHPSDDAKLLARWVAGPVPQEPVSIDHEVYIIAGMPLNGDALVYKFLKTADAHIVCILAPERTLQAAKGYLTHHTSSEK